MTRKQYKAYRREIILKVMHNEKAKGNLYTFKDIDRFQTPNWGYECEIDGQRIVLRSYEDAYRIMHSILGFLE